MKICPNCHAAFDDQPKFCAVCGTRLPESGSYSVLVTEDGIIEQPEESAGTAEASALADQQPSPALADIQPSPAPPVPAVKEPPSGRKEHGIRRFLLLLGITLLLVLSFVWGLSILRGLKEKAAYMIRDGVYVSLTDNGDLMGVSRSGRMIRNQSASVSSISDQLQSADGSLILFRTQDQELYSFDGSRFVLIAQDVRHFALSFDGSGIAYTDPDGELFLHRNGKAQRIASQVKDGFCLSPDGKTLAYVREEGEGDMAFFYNGREREIAKEALPVAISNQGTNVYYFSNKDVLYVQKGGSLQSRQKLADQTAGRCTFYLNASCEQIVVNDGVHTYYSEKGGERVKIASQPLFLVASEALARDGRGIFGLNSLKDKYYSVSTPEGVHIYHLSDSLEASRLIRNVSSYSLQKDGQTLIFSKNQNLYYINLEKAEQGEKKIASNHKSYLVSREGKQLLYIDEEGETWFAALGQEGKRVTADTVDMEQVVSLNNGFIYEMEGALYYTNGGKGIRVNGLGDDVQTLGGTAFVAAAECKNGEVYISTNGQSFKKLK